MKLFLTVIGCVMIFEGLPYFTAPQAIKEVLAMIQEMEEGQLRLVGFSLMLGGLLLVAVTWKIFYPA